MMKIVRICGSCTDQIYEKNAGSKLKDVESMYVLQLLHSNIDMVEKKMSQSTNKFVMILKCKDFSMLQMDFQNSEDLMNVATSIENLSNIGRYGVMVWYKMLTYRMGMTWGM